MTWNKYYILLNALALVILAGSIALNVLLYGQVKRFYLESNQIRLDPLGLSRYPVNLKQAADPDQIRVVFIGDSRAAAWTSPNMSGYEFVNRGINGQTSTQTLLRFADHVRSLQPDVVIIQVGVNDLKTIALFPERRESIIANCQANIKRIVENSRNLGAIVILTTIFPVGEAPLERRLFWSDQISQAVKVVNDYITTLASKQVIVFNTAAVLGDRQGMVLQQYQADELHLNKQGYAVLNQELVRLLDTVKGKK